MVGLPARGKSYVTKKIARYLNWLQHDTRIFNVGERRRVAAGGLGSNAPPSASRIQQPFRSVSTSTGSLNGVLIDGNIRNAVTPSTNILINGEPPPLEMLPSPALDLEQVEDSRDLISDVGRNTQDGKLAPETVAPPLHRTESMEKIHDASFFDPKNEQAAHIRDEIAMATLDELLDYILDQGGSVGIFDATNSTLERRKLVMERIRERAGPELGVLFLESLCVDEQLLESNMRLKLSGTCFPNVDLFQPVHFCALKLMLTQMNGIRSGLSRPRSCRSIGRLQEACGPVPVQVRSPGRIRREKQHALRSDDRCGTKGCISPDSRVCSSIYSFRACAFRFGPSSGMLLVKKGLLPPALLPSLVSQVEVGLELDMLTSKSNLRFLSAQTVYYLLNFNLAPRQIWITRHGESIDNVNGRIGGDSDLSEKGIAYAKALTNFIKTQRQAWDVHQRDKALSTHFPPLPGDTTPPNPEYNHGGPDDSESTKSFCVWTSMLKRSIQTAQFFDEDDYDTKQFKMLDELNAGTMEGLTYEEIRTNHNEEFRLRQMDKLHYRCGYIHRGFFHFSRPSPSFDVLTLSHDSCRTLKITS